MFIIHMHEIRNIRRLEDVVIDRMWIEDGMSRLLPLLTFPELMMVSKLMDGIGVLQQANGLGISEKVAYARFKNIREKGQRVFGQP